LLEDVLDITLLLQYECGAMCALLDELRATLDTIIHQMRGRLGVLSIENPILELLVHPVAIDERGWSKQIDLSCVEYIHPNFLGESRARHQAELDIT
jgi:hypothetical protein